ncbi:ATP synthase F1 subunit gamma [Candidatus Methylomirabilis sp.]|uniref:ATP synthase F1 subunit gamma n=1 Tax=Candidatus Methylomirabilis sp. TaxID=2032687 RepID=UPI002390A4CE|nr:ATP synthase F1 subunit gamma [Candidatus Methylomirabilis sp.]MDE2181273.1 ATP synthase F1 subunit gamma [candidate division NC10 bacterium]
MATLRDIKRRITSVKSTQQITKAMKLVAAAKLRRAQERILEARPYAFKMQEVLASLALRADPQYHPLLCRRETGKKIIVVIAADKGLCGGFNSNIMRRSLELLRTTPGETTVTLVVVGRKTRDFYRRRPYAIRSEQIGFFDRLAYDHAAALGRELANAYVAEEADEIQLVYNEFKSVATQRVVVERLLPIEPLQAPEELATIDFIYEPSPKAILEGLLPKHVEVQVYRALMESLAGEYGARMTAMDAASKNASEMIDLLTLQFNKARQERITKELLEVVGGAEALRAAKG